MQSKLSATHVAIIMDGNGRWAQKRNLPRTAGHKVGAETLRKIVEWTAQTDVEYLTCYAFSTENWKRPSVEVKFLMALLSAYLEGEVKNLKKNEVRLKVIGDISGLSSGLQKQIVKAESDTAGGDKLQLNLAINYGGQQDILLAIQKIAQGIKEDVLQPNDISLDLIKNSLSTQGIPEPDILIRPGGDYRISNFLLWEMAYTEFFFLEKWWPDFTSEDMREIIEEFENRERRFGGLNESGGKNA